MTLKPLAAVAAAAAVVLIGTGLNVSSAQQAEDPITLKMRFSEAKFQMIDNPPRMTERRPSESPGDMVVARGWLRDPSGDRAGRVHSTFTVTGGKSPRTTELATGVFKLKDGQLVMQGVIGSASTDVLPVVGGSGSYEGANGSVEITTGRRAVTFVFDLIP